MLAIPAGEPEAEGAAREIHALLAEWGARAPRGIVETVEDWLAEVVGGRTAFLEGGNTVELTLFDQNLRDRFVETVLPLVCARKNLECFVMEHRRREVDFRITVVNREEAIPAIVVPSESPAGAGEGEVGNGRSGANQGEAKEENANAGKENADVNANANATQSDHKNDNRNDNNKINNNNNNDSNNNRSNDISGSSSSGTSSGIVTGFTR